MTPKHESGNGTSVKKDWLIKILVGIVGTLLLIGIQDIRSRVKTLEEHELAKAAHYSVDSLRLGRMEKKLDAIFPDFGPAFNPNGGH